MLSLRSKPIFSSTSTVNKKKLETLCSNAASGLQMVLQITKEIAGETGVPGLAAGVGGLLFVIDIIKKTHQNTKDAEQLVQRIDELATMLQKSVKNGTSSSAILDRINGLAMTWITTADQVREIASRYLVTRFIRYSDDAQTISTHIQTITWSIQSFTVETLLAIEFALDEHTQFVRDAVTEMEAKMDAGFQRINARMDSRGEYGRLPRALFASFDYKVRDYCLEGTRTDVLDEIYHWIGIGQGNIEVKQRIFWINGSAGTGKTTVASTVAKKCKARNLLGASFFCSRDDAECSNPGLIFTTIANQLGQYFPSFAAGLALVLKAEPDIGYSSVPYQLQQLIVNPLRAVGNVFPECLVVIDALDECKDNGTTSIVMSSLSRHVADLSPLKFLITSRPEQRITSMFDSSDLNPETQRRALHEIELNVVQHDIEQYLTVNLKRIGASYKIDDSWPSTQDTHSLAVLSYGLFIFASTAGKYIEDLNYSDPKHQLAKLLMSATKGDSSPHRHLDELYLQVLAHAFPTISPDLAGRLRLVVGSIVLLLDSLSPLALEQLLSLRTNVVRETLAHLHSVIIVPDDDTNVIRLLHPSFFDFLTNPKRCRNPNFVVNAEAQHTILARACLNVMNCLKRDICGIKDPSLLNSEVEDLPERIQKHIPSHVQYACRHWAFHLANGLISDMILEHTQQFCSNHLLHWVEVCSLLGELRGALVSLANAQQALSNTIKSPSDVTTLLYDCEHFTREFFSIISISTLQVYHSALLFSPRPTLLRETYERDQMLPVKIHNASLDTWDSCIRTMEGHSKIVSSVVFSPDGTWLTSASWDETIRLWDVVSGMHMNTLSGHTGWVNSVAFFPDNSCIASGSLDSTIRLWDVVSGALLHTLQGHFNSVRSIAFSPDGTHLVSGSEDTMVMLWDPVTGAHQRTFQGRGGAVNAVAYSPDAKRIASGSDDRTIRIWNVSTGALLNTLKGHSKSVKSITFSFDGTHLASGSDDESIRLWNAVTGAQLKILKGHNLSVNSIVFSPNGSCLASGSEDSTVRLWDAVTGAPLDTFTISSLVYSVAFSPDGTRLASGSYDSNVRLWDVNRTRPRTISKHSSPVTCVAFTSDGKRIASGSEDATVRIWDASNGAHIQVLKRHSEWVTSVAFSQDGRRVVSGSDDGTVRLWDAASGSRLKTLEGHSRSVESAAFSPDGKLVVSGSTDTTFRMWDVGSGSQLKTFHVDSSSVLSVSFTPDGTHIVSGSSNRQINLWDLAGTRLDTTEGDHKTVPVISNTLHPSQTSLPPPHSVPKPAYSMKDGWIVSADQKRICWLPVSCRPTLYRDPFTLAHCHFAVGTRDGRVVIFDLSGLENQ